MIHRKRRIYSTKYKHKEFQSNRESFQDPNSKPNIFKPSHSKKSHNKSNKKSHNKSNSIVLKKTINISKPSKQQSERPSKKKELKKKRSHRRVCSNYEFGNNKMKLLKEI